MRVLLSAEQQSIVLRPINGKGGFQSLLRRLQRSWDPVTSTIEVSKQDLTVILRELGRGPRGGFQKRLLCLEPQPAPAKADLRRVPLRIKRA